MARPECTPTEFHAMRQRLQGRGLLDDEFRLTRAGIAFVERTIGELGNAEATNDPDGPRVFWPHLGRNGLARCQ